MGLIIGLVVLFILLFVLGVPNEIIVFLALVLLLVFSIACLVFFIVSLLNLLQSKKLQGKFIGFVSWSSELARYREGNLNGKENINNTGNINYTENKNKIGNINITESKNKIENINITESKNKIGNINITKNKNITESKNNLDNNINKENKVLFAGYRVDGENYRNLFPTDEFMMKMYKRDDVVDLRLCKIGRNKYVIDSITVVIIAIGLPVFSIMTAVLIPLALQYSYIFNMNV